MEEEEEEMDNDPEGYILGQTGAFDQPPVDLQEPLLGPDDLDRRRNGKMKVPVKLQVYHGRFGHWEREGLRKYKGQSTCALQRK